MCSDQWPKASRSSKHWPSCDERDTATEETERLASWLWTELSSLISIFKILNVTNIVILGSPKDNKRSVKLENHEGIPRKQSKYTLNWNFEGRRFKPLQTKPLQIKQNKNIQRKQRYNQDKLRQVWTLSSQSQTVGYLRDYWSILMLCKCSFVLYFGFPRISLLRDSTTLRLFWPTVWNIRIFMISKSDRSQRNTMQFLRIITS